MSQQIFNRKVLERFLNEEELKRLEEDYNDSKHQHAKTDFDEEEVRMFKEAKMTLEDWQKHWDLKSRESVARRLGCLYLFVNGFTHRMGKRGIEKPKEN